MKIETALKRYVGDFGRYQLFVVTLVFIMCLPDAFDSIGYVFYAATPDHWCQFPRRHDVINMTDAQWKRFAIPRKEEGKMKFEKCVMYTWANEPNLTAEDINKTLTEIEQGTKFSNNDTVVCDQFEYDTSAHVRNSLVTEWNMVCSRAWMRPNIATVFLIGWVIGRQLTGYLSDRFGRRPVLVIEAICVSVLFLILPFCNHYVAFLVIRGLLAIPANSITIIHYPLILEAVGTKYRTVISNFYVVMWGISYMAVAGVAYGIRTWFNLLIVLAPIAAVLRLIPAFFLPESLLWQAAKGHKKEALATLRRMARWNRRCMPPDIKIEVNQDKQQQRTSLLDLLRRPNICRISTIMCLIWFINGLVYYNISWNADTLHGNLYLNVFISGLLEVPANLLNIPVIQYAGRRLGTSICTLMVGVLYLISIFVPGMGRTVLILAARFFIGMTFSMIYQYTAELYPTVARTTAMGFVNWFARGGVFISSYMPLMGPFYSAIICAVICIAGAASLLLLPETMYAPLPVNVQEVEERGKLNVRDILTSPCSLREATTISRDEEQSEKKQFDQTQPLTSDGFTE